jgi:Ca2+-binding RTX toxin-like protein
MAIINFYDQSVDMLDTNVTDFAQGGVVSHSSTEVVFQDSTGFGELDVHGRHFADFDSNGVPQAGVITGFDGYFFGTPVASFAHLRLDVPTFNGFVAANDSQGLVDLVLRGNDQITGSSQNDILIGLKGRDHIDGSTGDDVLIGGVGGDTLTGGAGDDVFHYDRASDSGKRGVDTITDLSTGDQIDLADIDADIHTAGDQAFHLVDRLRGHAGELTLRYDGAHDRTIVSFDVNGDATADGIIWLSGDHHDFTDFIL